MEIRTKRLLLREFIPSDWEAVFAFRNNPRYRTFYPGENESESQAQLFIDLIVGEQKALTRRTYQLAITLKDNSRMIGNAGIRLRALGGHETAVLQADIGYEIDPHYWGRGYATEAARSMLDFGFETLGVHRIWAQCLAENQASVRVLEKLGMQQEGRLREDEFFKGRYWDTLLFAILKGEWRSNRVK